MDTELARNKHLALYEIERRRIDMLPDEPEEYNRKIQCHSNVLRYYSSYTIVTIVTFFVQVLDGVGIILIGAGSSRDFIQRIGRLLRPKPDSDRKAKLIIIRNS